MRTILVVGGWVAGGAGFLSALAAWRLLGMRMEAVARASHELRGPITAARLGLELGAREELSSSRVRAIDLELARAGRALEDLAAARHVGGLTRLRAAATHRRWVPRRHLDELDVQDLLADAVEAWRAAAAAGGMELRLRRSGRQAPVWGDRLRLAQALGNLIANAVEHGRGTIEVGSRAEDGRVRIEVVDGGDGLPAPVGELSGRAVRGRGARGRGLAIAAAIAAEHGGRLAAAPSERGARLVLELPAGLTRPRLVGDRDGPLGS